MAREGSPQCGVWGEGRGECDFSTGSQGSSLVPGTEIIFRLTVARLGWRLLFYCLEQMSSDLRE